MHKVALHNVNEFGTLAEFQITRAYKADTKHQRKIEMTKVINILSTIYDRKAIISCGLSTGRNGDRYVTIVYEAQL